MCDKSQASKRQRNASRDFFAKNTFSNRQSRSYPKSSEVEGTNEVILPGSPATLFPIPAFSFPGVLGGRNLGSCPNRPTYRNAGLLGTGQLSERLGSPRKTTKPWQPHRDRRNERTQGPRGSCPKALGLCSLRKKGSRSHSSMRRDTAIEIV